MNMLTVSIIKAFLKVFKGYYNKMNSQNRFLAFTSAYCLCDCYLFIGNDKYNLSKAKNCMLDALEAIWKFKVMSKPNSLFCKLHDYIQDHRVWKCTVIGWDGEVADTFYTNNYDMRHNRYQLEMNGWTYCSKTHRLIDSEYFQTEILEREYAF